MSYQHQSLTSEDLGLYSYTLLSNKVLSCTFLLPSDYFLYYLVSGRGNGKTLVFIGNEEGGIWGCSCLLLSLSLLFCFMYLCIYNCGQLVKGGIKEERSMLEGHEWERKK